MKFLIVSSLNCLHRFMQEHQIFFIDDVEVDEEAIKRMPFQEVRCCIMDRRISIQG